MQVKLNCPQCQAGLVLPDSPRPGKAVTCPQCQLKFVLSVAPGAAAALGSAAPGTGRSLVGLMLLAIGIGVGVGGAVWYQGRDQNSPDNKVVENKPQQQPDKNADDNVEPKQPEAANPKPNPAPMAEAKAPAGEPKSPFPEVKAPAAPMSNPMAEEAEPIPPKPLTKKPPPKTYAETKRPAVDDTPLTVPPVAAAAAPPMEPAAPPHLQQKQIDEAINRGVEFLKKTQLASGGWPRSREGGAEILFNFDIGYACMGGLTLLECGALRDDPAIQKAARYVRATPITDPMHRTYEMSVAILFLDRLGDPQDRDLIQAYALQLVAGQRHRGGWNYDCPKLTNGEMSQLLSFLQATRIAPPEPLAPLKGRAATAAGGPPAKEAKEPAPKSAAKKPAALPRPPAPPLQSLPRGIAMMPIVQLYYFNKLPAPSGPNVPPMVGGPNPPAPGAPNLLQVILPGMAEDNSNSQFAMLALWTARRHGVPTERSLVLAGQRYAATQNEDGGWSYHEGGLVKNISTGTMTCVGLLALAMANASVPPKGDVQGKLPDNPAIAKALHKLGEHVDAASMKNLYLLWSIERVGMLYNLKTIGNREWYEVGVEVLLPGQQAEGNWVNGGYLGSTQTVDTCFALLFLKRSNLVQDLSERLPFLMAISDPAARPMR